MKLDIADQWVAALRSGDYEQGKIFLNLGGKLCCLGVASELAYQNGVCQREVSDDHVYYTQGETDDIHYDSSDAGLIEAVKEFLGTNSLFGSLGYIREPLVHGGEFYGSLSSANDAGVPFSVIADYIEAHAAEL